MTCSQKQRLERDWFIYLNQSRSRGHDREQAPGHLDDEGWICGRHRRTIPRCTACAASIRVAAGLMVRGHERSRASAVQGKASGTTPYAALADDPGLDPASGPTRAASLRAQPTTAAAARGTSRSSRATTPGLASNSSCRGAAPGKGLATAVASRSEIAAPLRHGRACPGHPRRSVETGRGRMKAAFPSSLSHPRRAKRRAGQRGWPGQARP